MATTREMCELSSRARAFSVEALIGVKRQKIEETGKNKYVTFNLQGKHLSGMKQLYGSLDSSVGIATGYGWMAEGSEFESRKGEEFSLLHVVQTGCGVHPISYPMGTEGSFPGVKRPGREVNHSPPTSAEVKKM
jgi:hypothetical protein